MSDNEPPLVVLVVLLAVCLVSFIYIFYADMATEEPDICTTVGSGTQLGPVTDVADVPGYRVLVTAGNRTYAEYGDPEEWQEGDMLYRVRREMFPFIETHYVAVPAAAMDWCAQRGDAER